MKRAMIWMWVVGMALAGGVAWGEARVENVRAQQRARSRVVDVWYDLVSDTGGVFEVSLKIGCDGVEPPLSTVGGDIGADIEPGRNKRIEWDAGADWSGHVQSNFVATVTAERMEEADTGPSKGMVRIPGGTNSGETPDEWSAYSLTVESFYMDKTEVTYAHWKRVYNWAVEHGYSFAHEGSGKGENHPVHTVNWFDCAKWCNARSEMEGRTPAYWSSTRVFRTGEDEKVSANLEGAGYRLPTDDEWRYAARGGLRNRRFPWGDTISHAKANYCKMWYDSWDTGERGYHPRYNDGVQPYTAPVGSFQANGYGLYDMAGNVWEWTTEMGHRSGSWAHESKRCRCGDMTWVSSGGGYHVANFSGFRTVRRR